MKWPSGWIVASIAIAAGAFWWGPLRWFVYGGANGIPDHYNLTASIWLGWIWTGSFIAAIVVRKRQAPWLLLVAPFAVYWPAMWIFVARACDLVGHCGD